MHPIAEHDLNLTRRRFIGRTATGIGAIGLASLLEPDLLATSPKPRDTLGGLPDLPDASGTGYDYGNFLPLPPEG